MEISGKVHLIGQTEEVGNNGFTKRQLVVVTDEQYPQHIAIDFLKDKTSVLDNYRVGDEVKVSINVRGSEYKGKYYVNLTGWKIDKVAGSEEKYSGKKELSEPLAQENEPDSLPF